MEKYIKYTWFLVGVVFLVVLAGGIVRTTHSGMGCPDWPTCFGKWIPPTSVEQLPADFQKYLSKQDIDHSFNVYHTWIEYINRLLGALLGVFILIHFIWSFIIRRTVSKGVVFLSFLLLVLVAFTGWLGKVVVDENLAVSKITLHMFSALLLAVLPIGIIRLATTDTYTVGKKTGYVVYTLLGILLVQFILGTEVREQVDDIAKKLSYQDRGTWISLLDNIFVIHRSLSWLILGLSLYIYLASTERAKLVSKGVLSLVGVQFLLGVLFSYFSFPAFAQPVHLLVSFLLITLVIYMLMHQKLKDVVS